MGLQGPPYAVLSPLVTDPLAPPGDPESSLFLTCHFVRKGWWKTKSPNQVASKKKLEHTITYHVLDSEKRIGQKTYLLSIILGL